MITTKRHRKTVIFLILFDITFLLNDLVHNKQFMYSADFVHVLYAFAVYEWAKMYLCVPIYLVKDQYDVHLPQMKQELHMRDTLHIIK